MTYLEPIEDFSEFHKKFKDIFKEHYSTCEADRSLTTLLAIDTKLFQTYIDAGVFNFFYIKEEATVVGYINITIQDNPLYSKAQAVIDYLFVLPEHRRKGHTSAAISLAEVSLKDMGIGELNISLPDKEYAEGVSEGLGYVKTSSVYYKELGE